MSDKVRTDYLGSVFDPSRFGHTVKRALVLARKALEKEEFDSIAFTGNSGAALAYILASELGVALICIRKETDNSHYSQGGQRLEGYTAAKRYLFVDDFICSGRTYENVVEYLQTHLPDAKCVGALMYGRTGMSSKNRGLPLYSAPAEEDGSQVSFKSYLYRRSTGSDDSEW